ncbi:MAG: alpha/beta hydrolase [Chloroflexota bacterium]|nr:alpha/beta hydrolase [Chloroflexota bacterium]
MSKPIVFIHGSGDSARVWGAQLDQFDAHPTYAIDLPGHGERPDTLPAQVSVLDYAHAVHEISEDELHLAQPIIAGHSLGGAVALMMALAYSAELGGLILIGTGARLRVHPDLLASARAEPRPALYRDLAACNDFDIMGQMPDIHLPTLIICGADDRMTPVKYSQYLHTRIAGSELRVIAQAGHYVMREQPEAVKQAIQEWLARDGVPAPSL